MAPAVLVDLDLEASGRAPRIVVWSVAGGAGHAGRAAITSAVAESRPSRVFLAKPAAIIAAAALHANNSAPAWVNLT
jgi:hypothetical protein